MKLIVNENSINSGGTSLQGYINISHDKLVKKLGEGLGTSDKVLDGWDIEGEVDGERVVATLYDWKNYGMNPEDITNWHIGGFDSRAVDLIRQIFHSANIRRR